MAYDHTFIAAALQNQWNLWNIRGLMILSLCMQLLLAIVAPFRQRTSNRFVIFVIWSAYLLADWAAMFVFGLISNTRCRNLENDDVQVPPDLLAFWAAFLLVHLGGPDTITAFSMEDNALWTRHLVALTAQLSVFVYIFVKTLPNNRLLVPTLLMFVAGAINYGERTRALYLASLENLKKTFEKATDRPSLENLTETIANATIRGQQSVDVSIFHGILKGLVVDIVPDLQECNKSRALILHYPTEVSLGRISGQLKLLYELLYTKIMAANSTWGKIARAITYYNTLMAFILFCTGQKQHQIHGGDLAITRALFGGVFIVHVANMMTFMTSLFPDSSNLKELILVVLWQGIFLPFMLLVLDSIISIFAEPSAVTCFSLRRHGWNKMASFNILSHCFKQSTLKKRWKLGFIWKKLAGERQQSGEGIDRRHFDWRHISGEDIDIKLWISICKDIQENAAETINEARMRELYEARGDRALERNGCHQLMTFIKGFQYEDTLLIWHIATEICFYIDPREPYINNSDRMTKRIFSKKLSDYMVYLLVRRPKLMSAVAGISHIRYKDTCAELKLLGRKLEVLAMRQFCESILREHANDTEQGIEENSHGFSLLKYSCWLVEYLREDNNRWEVLYEVWVELLWYAAGHCRVDSHARQLSEGGEFITAIWILMSLCGIGNQFPVN